MPDPAPGRRARLERIAFGLGLLALVVIGYRMMPAEAPPPDLPELAETTPEIGEEPDATEPPTRQTTTAPDAPLAPNRTLHLDPATFAPGEPVVVHLALPEPSADDAPRPVRLVSQPDHRLLELEGRLSGDRGVAAIDVDPGYLTPGAYLVEVKTTERTHFPVRRYVIVVGE